MKVNPRSKSFVLLALPPSANHLFATVKGRRVKSRQYKAWLADAGARLVELRKPESLPVTIRVMVFGAVSAARDLDNMLKPIGDALVAAGLLPGDSIRHVTGWHVTYEPDGEDPVAGVSLLTPAGATE